MAGILGFACVGIAIYIAYSTMGTTVGHFTLLGTALCGFGVTYYVLRSKTWKRMQLHTQIDSTVEGVDESIREGDDIATKTGTGLGTGIGVKWKKNFTPISVVLNDETFRNNVYNNTLYEEFDLDIINRIINALI